MSDRVSVYIRDSKLKGQMVRGVGERRQTSV